MDLDRLLQSGRRIRVIGFDDGPPIGFDHSNHASRRPPRGTPIPVAGIIASDTRMEGMLWGSVGKDEMDATERITGMLLSSKFSDQVQLVLTDGITVGGANVIDLAELSQRTGLPVVAVMRKPPKMETFRAIFDHFDDGDHRREIVERAGRIHEWDGWTFQCHRIAPEVAARVLQRLTDRGKVPEALRLAHLITAAVAGGQSSRRA